MKWSQSPKAAFAISSLHRSTALFWIWHLNHFKSDLLCLSPPFSDMLLGGILSYHLWERNWWSEVVNEQLEAQGIYIETESTVALNAFSLMLFEARMEVLVKDKCIWHEVSGWRTEPYFWLYHSVQRACAVWKLKYEVMRIGAWLRSGNCKTKMLV